MVTSWSREHFEFLCVDFKEISQKLEETDKKSQTNIQILVALITVVVAILASDFLKSYSHNSYRLLLIASFILSYFCEFLFLFVLIGLKTHNEYLCMMNQIRAILLIQSGATDGFLKDYGYIEAKPPKPLGMMYLTLFLLWGFMILLQGFSLSLSIIMDNKYWISMGCIAILVIIVWNTCILKSFRKVMKDRCLRQVEFVSKYKRENMKLRR